MQKETVAFGDQRKFPKTDWNLLQPADGPNAIDLLARRYWKPLYYFVRRHHFDIETSKDIVQSFLAHAMVQGTFFKADAKRGRLRTFLLAALENFIRTWQRSASRLKRGGGVPLVSLGSSPALVDYSRSFMTREAAPDRGVHRAWALGLMQKSIDELDGNPRHLTAFKLFQSGLSYEQISEKTGMSPIASKVAVHRMRTKLRLILTARIAAAIGPEEDLSAELSEFVSLLS